VRSTGEEREVFSGETLFLEARGGGFGFSAHPTELAVQVVATQGAVVAHLSHHDFVLREERARGTDLRSQPYVATFERAKGWGPDLLVQNYGGSEYSSLASKCRLMFSTYGLFVGKGDLLVWKEGEWRDAEEGTMGLPLAEVKSTQGAIRLDVWDESGTSSHAIVLQIESVQKRRIEFEKLVTAVRPRAWTEVSCLLEGKRRAVVRSGDWWLRSERGWRRLHQAHEIEQCLNHRLQGELFIFDTVAVDKGEAVLKGRWFDPMRASSHEIALAVPVGKQPSIAKRKSAKDPSRFIAKTAGRVDETSRMP
jgi:hypothetical protein